VGNTVFLPTLAAKIRQAIIHNNNQRNRIFLKLENYKACCCDERCEFVESSQTPIAHAVYGVALKVALCEYRAKRDLDRLVSREIQNLVHSHQQNFRTFLKPSPQGAKTGSQPIMKKVKT
jgi:hypothetical protein